MIKSLAFALLATVMFAGIGCTKNIHEAKVLDASGGAVAVARAAR